MPAPTRRRLVAVLAAGVVVLAIAASLLLVAHGDPLGAALRRVPMGGDELAVAAAVGRPAEGVIVQAGRSVKESRRVLMWTHGDAQLLVHFDEDGRAVHTKIHRGPDLSPWNWLRSWLPW